MLGGAVVVMDGQYGSTGKGKAVVYLAQLLKACMAVRCGGPNAGHTVYFGDTPVVMRQIPSAVVIPDIELGIAAGAMVDVPLLVREFDNIASVAGDAYVQAIHQRLYIDPMTALVDSDAGDQEAREHLGESVGSTQTGTGWTASQRCLRRAKLFRDGPRSFYKFLDVVSRRINTHIDAGDYVLIEGTQGTGLSLFHAPHYPFCTSKDTNSATFLAEAGVAPSACAGVVMVLRTYPIRVGGNSGSMHMELTWDTIAERSGRPPDKPLVEMTSVTRKVRRVGEFDWDLLDIAIRLNRPRYLIVHGLDYLNYCDTGVTQFTDLSQSSRAWIQMLQERSGVSVLAAFTGPHQDHIVPVVRTENLF